MAGNHRASPDTISIIRTAVLNKKDEIRRPRSNQFRDSKLKFPILRTVTRASHKRYRTIFKANRPNTFRQWSSLFNLRKSHSFPSLIFNTIIEFIAMFKYRSAEQISHIHVLFLFFWRSLFFFGSLYFFGLFLLGSLNFSSHCSWSRWRQCLNFFNFESKLINLYPDYKEKAAMFLNALLIMIGTVASMG